MNTRPQARTQSAILYNMCMIVSQKSVTSQSIQVKVAYFTKYNTRYCFIKRYLKYPIQINRLLNGHRPLAPQDKHNLCQNIKLSRFYFLPTPIR